MSRSMAVITDPPVIADLEHIDTRAAGNPPGRAASELLAVHTDRSAAGQYYRHQTTVAGEETGMACRSADGQWKVRIRDHSG